MYYLLEWCAPQRFLSDCFSVKFCQRCLNSSSGEDRNSVHTKRANHFVKFLSSSSFCENLFVFAKSPEKYLKIICSHPWYLVCFWKSGFLGGLWVWIKNFIRKRFYEIDVQTIVLEFFENCAIRFRSSYKKLGSVNSIESFLISH